ATDTMPMKGAPVLPSRAALMTYHLARAAGPMPVALALIPGDPIDLERSQFKPGKLQVVTRTAVITTALQDGRFPTWRNVLEGMSDIRCTVRIDNAARLSHVLGLAVAATNSESRGVEFTAAGGSIMMNSESNTKGKADLFLTNVDMDGQATVTLDALWLR